MSPAGHVSFGVVAVLGLLDVLPASPARAEDVQVAVAANFAAPMRAIAAGFERESGYRVLLAFGSTGAFYAQIRNGAPFDVLLAADAETPARLARDGLAVSASQFTYAVGRLVLWSPKTGVVDERGEVLRKGAFGHLAIANPALAPYGAAAVQVLKALGLYDALRTRLVEGENIAQTYQFVLSGNAELGFVALSQVWRDGRLTGGSAWLVPARLYGPIRQDAILLERGRKEPGAASLLEFLKSPAARTVINAYGYGR